ncbi:MAG: phosphate ABC transporter permease [Haloarculaceae archaeon]
MSESTVDRSRRQVERKSRRRLPGTVGDWRRGAIVGAAFLAVLPTLARIGANAPGTAPVDLAAAGDALTPIGLAGPAIAALVLGASERDSVAGIGLLFIGVFGLLATGTPGALVPAAVAMPAGAAIVVLSAIGPGTADTAALAPTRTQVATGGLLLAGAVASLAGALGVSSGTLRPLGSHLALLGAAASPVFFPTRSRDWLVGGATAGGVVTAAAAAPFVLGAVLLVGLGVVGTPLVLVAAGLGGLAVAGAAAARLRTPTGLAAVALLFAGGTGASAGGAIAVCLAVVVLARGGVDRPPTETGGDPA